MCGVDPSDSKQWIQQRALQIQQYHELHLAVASARVITTVKETLCLQDINELKVFVDLASISAGENDLDVDRVACFHDAVLGYSSMLYDLKKDSGFQTFKDVLKKLWRALENDRLLPKKLVRTRSSLL
ncbi:hypothetical protein CRUP_005986 [Coryphaenoides rupestris]|nr:hypothetical protein CRUP_005986 [Coryphaenoides rupestris]